MNIKKINRLRAERKSLEDNITAPWFGDTVQEIMKINNQLQDLYEAEKPVIRLEYNLTEDQKNWMEHEAHETRRMMENEYLEGYSNDNNF